jgi:hypothetical protein
MDREVANLVADQELRLGQQLEPVIEFTFRQRQAFFGRLASLARAREI